jgi:hypothetical protein
MKTSNPSFSAAVFSSSIDSRIRPRPMATAGSVWPHSPVCGGVRRT